MAKRLNKFKCIASRVDEAIRSQESGDRGSVLDLVSDLVKSNKITLSSMTIFLAQKCRSSLGGIVMSYNYPEGVLSYLFCSQPDEGKKIKN